MSFSAQAAARKRAGLPALRWHDLRHTWATWHAQAGTPAIVLQALGGWKDARMVRTYTNLAAIDLLDHANAIRLPTILPAVPVSTDPVADEANSSNPVVLVQDYHFALLPRMIRERLPEAMIIAFWHIPWPNPEAFAICPWRAEIVEGLLGSSILGFHTLVARCRTAASQRCADPRLRPRR
jgi:hypothetical protein